MDVGADTKKTLASCDTGKQKTRLYDMGKFYQSTVKYQAIKKKDFKEMNIAQGLLDVAKSNLDKISTAMSKCIDERNEIGKKRMRMIDSFLSKANQDKN